VAAACVVIWAALPGPVNCACAEAPVQSTASANRARDIQGVEWIATRQEYATITESAT
jgi:hypothetical protein